MSSKRLLTLLTLYNFASAIVWAVMLRSERIRAFLNPTIDLMAKQVVKEMRRGA